MDYTEEELQELIKDATKRGKVDLLRFYQTKLEEIKVKEDAHAE